MPPRTLSTADERRENVLTAAVDVAAVRGLHAPTTAFAQAAGISHAYLFRLFPTKTDLAIALMGRVHERILAAFADAADQADTAGTDRLEAMGAAYVDLIKHDRALLTVQLQGHAAAVSDPDFRESMREGFAQIVEFVQQRAGAEPEALDRFFATGMLLNVLGAMDAFELDEPWAQMLCCAPQVLMPPASPKAQ